MLNYLNTTASKWFRYVLVNKQSQANIVLETSVSKTEWGLGAGTYGGRRGTKILISLGTYAIVFQAEHAAIVQCTKELENQDTNTSVSVSDLFRLQDSAQSLEIPQVNSKFVLDCLEAPQQIVVKTKCPWPRDQDIRNLKIMNSWIN